MKTLHDIWWQRGTELFETAKLYGAGSFEHKKALKKYWWVERIYLIYTGFQRWWFGFNK